MKRKTTTAEKPLVVRKRHPVAQWEADIQYATDTPKAKPRIKKAESLQRGKQHAHTV